MSRPKLRRYIAIALFAGSALTGNAQAASSKAPCYTAAEFEAEQAIRLHTELMVIGLTCQHMDTGVGPSLFARYRQFTDIHQDKIRVWEKALISHIKRTKKGNATRAFDTFRTNLANEASQRAIALSTPVFCQTHAPLIDRVMGMSADDLMQEIAATGTPRVGSMPRCDVPAQIAAVPASAKPAQ